MTTVVTVDDSDVVRALWRVMLARIAHMTLVAECAHVSTGLAAIRRYMPDIVLLDIELDDGSGMEVMKMVRAECPATSVIIVSNFADPFVREHFARAGATAFFDKSYELRALSDFLKCLASDNRLLPLPMCRPDPIQACPACHDPAG